MAVASLPPSRAPGPAAAPGAAVWRAHLVWVARLLAVPTVLALVISWAVRTRPSRPYQAGQIEANIAAFAEGKYDLKVETRDVVILGEPGKGRRKVLILG